MNDSFLEDLDLIPKEKKKKPQQQPDCHITIRNATSSPLPRFSEQDERDNAVQLQKKYPVITNISDGKLIKSKDVSSKDFDNKQSNQNVKKHSMNIKISEKVEKVGKEKSVDVKVRLDNKQQSTSREHKIKSQETRTQSLKVPENKIVNKSHKRYSEPQSTLTSVREKRRSSDSSNSHSPDVSSKENSRPNSSKEIGSRDLNKAKGNMLDESRRSSFKISDRDLAVIKELISTHTRNESTRILHAIQEVYVNSQATLIKQLLNQTDDLVEEMHLCTDKKSDRVKKLIEENERLQIEIFGLRREIGLLRQENADLKLQCTELIKQTNF